MFVKKDSIVVFEYFEFNFFFIIGDEINGNLFGFFIVMYLYVVFYCIILDSFWILLGVFY